jgi:hypothetical protein
MPAWSNILIIACYRVFENSAAVGLLLQKSVNKPIKNKMAESCNCNFTTVVDSDKSKIFQYKQNSNTALISA